MKILIVEDEIIPANYLKKILTHEGYEVIKIVETGFDAIQVAHKENPDLILMDVMLQDHISGCDAALEISKKDPQVLIVFLTAFSDKEMIDFAVASKAFGYLLKPYRDKEILATIELAKAHLGYSTPTVKDNNILTLVDGYTYHTESQSLFYQSKEVLTCGPKALELIALLCKHKDYTVKIKTIHETLWDTPRSQQTLRSLVHRIRENTSQNLIINISKVGYKIGLKQ